MTEGNGEKSDESSEKYVIEKPEGDEKDEEDGNKDDIERTLCVDKKISLFSGQKLPPGWEKHEGDYHEYFHWDFFVVSNHCRLIFHIVN